MDAKKFLLYLCAIYLIFGTVQMAYPDCMVDFENVGLEEGNALTSQIPRLLFSGATIAEEGKPEYAFHSRKKINGRKYIGEVINPEVGFSGLFVI